MINMQLYGQDLQLTTNFSADRWMTCDADLALRLSREVELAEGKLALFIGAMDVTDLCSVSGRNIIYRPSFMLLPEGETEVTVFMVSPDNSWQEIARLTLRVLTEYGFEKVSVDPTLSINNNGQVAEGHSPETNTPSRKTFQDFTGQLGLNTELVRGNSALRSQWAIVGSSEQEQALRFGEKGNSAPKVDLSNYLIQLQSNALEFSFGHVSHGRHRHLINFFNSRGAMARTHWGSRLDLSFAAMNGTSIAGWSNFIGLNENRHRIYSGTFGLEALSRPGALRLEGSFIDGSVLPFNNFNQANITDAEKSQGYGLRLQASDPTRRLRMDGGFANSKYVNPNDPFLQQGFELVEVKETTSNARYLDFGVGVLQNVQVSPTWQANLMLNYRHERVDPLYRTVAAFARSDFLENAFDVQSNIGYIALQYSHSRSEDNLDEIPSILKTRTRINSINSSLQLPYMFNPASGPINCLPQMNYSYSQTHQFGASLPQDGGFSDGHVPDQISAIHNASFNWQASMTRFGYTLAFSSQDNRQPGRENADFRNVSNTFALGVTPWNRLDLSFDLGFEDAKNKEIDRTDLTRRYGVNVNLRTTNTSTFNFSLSTTNASDDAQTSESNNTFVNAQWSLGFRWNKTSTRQLVQGQLFVRYSLNESDFRDNTFGFASDTSNWTMNTGMNLSLF